MIRLLFFFIFVFALFSAQQDTNWYAFYNSDSTKIGFKDSDGKIKIEPKFENAMMSTDVFKQVIAIWEYAENYSGEQYYLNKNGKKFGKDSLYIFDFSFAKESEGLIKFHDSKTDKVGFFNFDGKVAIPALYNDAQDFHNGIALVLKGAKKEYWETKSDQPSEHSGCNHWSWVGGKTIAITSSGTYLFEIDEYYDLVGDTDFGNVQINKNLNPNFHITLKGSDGNSYSFYQPLKEFSLWFSTVFMSDFNKNKTVLSKYFYELISVDDNDDQKFQTAWKNHSKKEYLKKNQKKIDELFSKIKDGTYSFEPFWEHDGNYLYYPENKLPKEDLKEAVTISIRPRTDNDFSSNNSFQFTKIGDTFMITSAP